MRLGFFLFLVTVPFLAALGFDYADYRLDPSEGFNYNILGKIWAQNFEDSYIAARDSMDPQNWAIITAFLKQPAALLGFLFAHIIFILVAFLKLLGWFTRWKRSMSDDENEHNLQDVRDLDFLRKNRQENYKYKKRR